MVGLRGGKGPRERVLKLQEVGVLRGKAAENQGREVPRQSWTPDSAGAPLWGGQGYRQPADLWLASECSP